MDGIVCSQNDLIWQESKKRYAMTKGWINQIYIVLCDFGISYGDDEQK
jgi:hypothetical protein